MGCVSSKKIRCDSPTYDDVCSTSCIGGSTFARRQRSARLSSSASLPAHVDALHLHHPRLKDEVAASEALVVLKVEAPLSAVAEEKGPERKRRDLESSDKSRELRTGASQKKAAAAGLGVSQNGRMTEAELAAAGWPSWLTAVAADAIDGWVPLKAEAYERLDKVTKFTFNHLKIQSF